MKIIYGIICKSIAIYIVVLLLGCEVLNPPPPPPAPPAPPLPTEPPPITILGDDGWIQKESFYEKTVHYGTSRPDKCKKILSQVKNYIMSEDYEMCLNDPFRLNTGNDESEKIISYGVAKVKIPFVKEVGGTSGMSLVSLDHDIGWDKFISNLSDRDILIFVHGFNTSFSSSAIRCAQLAHDTNFKGEAVFFSWPSEVNPFTYDEDKARAQENFKLLADFLQDISSNTDKNIHIVAHSMGTYILMNSLAIINERISTDDNLLFSRRKINNGKIFSQIILAAPDIATDDYHKNFLKNNFSEMATNITLYSSVNDRVLDVSKVVNVFIEGKYQVRLGDSSEEFFVIDGMDTIDTRQEIKPQFFGHSFYANYRSLVSDIHILLNYGTNPDGRMLQKVTDKNGNNLWFIRD